MTNMRETFQVMATALTGIAQRIVVRADQNANFFGYFVSLCNAEGVGRAEYLLSLFDKITSQGASPSQAVEFLLAGKFDARPPPGFPPLNYSGLTRALSLFALTGGWNSNLDTDNLQIPSPVIYTEGLVWRIAQAHAQGHSDMDPQSWGNPPEPLSKYIGA
jgi:hypothetical protein